LIPADGIEIAEPDRFEVVSGRGVRVVLGGEEILAGNLAFLAENGVRAPQRTGEEGQTAIYIAASGRALGRLRLADHARPGAREAIRALKASGVKRVVMLTGDNRAVAERIGAELGVDEVESELLPDAKVDLIRRYQAQGHLVAMVGDGINDAPALAAADVGIAMGVAGTQAALEAADVALMTDDLGRIVEARAIALRAYRTIKENLLVGVGVVHVAGIIAALLRLIGPVQAALIHLGPDILVFLNSVKLLRIPIRSVAVSEAGT